MMLAGHGLTIGYPDRVVGAGLDVALATGEVLALLGPNGGGKTTLLKTLLGLLPPKAGEVRLDGRALSARSIRERARLIAYVPQTHAATFAFPVEAVVLMGRTAHGGLLGRPSAKDRAVAAAVLEHLGLAGLAQRPYTMSRAASGSSCCSRARLRRSRSSSCSTSPPPVSTSATRAR